MDIKDSSFYSVKIGDKDNVIWKGDRLRNYLIAHSSTTNIEFEKQSKLKKAQKIQDVIEPTETKTKKTKAQKDIITDVLTDTNSN
jgi:hypothetical protein